MNRAFGALAIVVLCCCPLTISQAGEQPEVVKLMPQGDLGDGFKAAGAPEHFVGQKLFDYMNGGAELYLAFGFADLAVAEYKQGELSLRVALYRMGSPAEAYGIWSFAASGKEAGMSGPHSLSPNMLSFFRGRYYVRVLSQKVSPKINASMVVLGKKLYAGLPGKSEVPAEIALLPKGHIAGTLRYLTHPETGRTVWFDGEGKIFLKDGTTAVTATYPGDDDDIQLTRAQYVDAKGALICCQNLAKKMGLKVELKGEECRASGKNGDDVFVSIATQVRILRWASGPADQVGADAWLKKIK